MLIGNIILPLEVALLLYIALTKNETKTHVHWRTSQLEKIHLSVNHPLAIPANRSQLPLLSSGLSIEIKKTQEILDSQDNLGSMTSSFEVARSNNLVVAFPVYKVADLLYQSYEANVAYLCPIVHLPTLRSLIKTFYLRIGQGERVSPGQSALLLSIFAVAAYFYRTFDAPELARSEQDSVLLSKCLSRGALDMLEYSRRNTSGTLEDIQAHIHMSFVIYHFDGFSARGRILAATAATIAREMRLHRLDAERETVIEDESDHRTLIENEVKRRVFWNIASTDWLFSMISGPQEGTYSIHPNHIAVNIPKDCTDVEIILGEANEAVAGGLQPTGMSFFLARLRLAHLCREMADTIPLKTCKLIQMPYEQILAMDKRLQEYNTQLPFFFRLDAESRRRSKLLEVMYPGLPVSRYLITTELHSRRWKLHQRFLLRQSYDARYSYSRQACLESARTVIQVYADLLHNESQSTVPELMGMVVHYTHLALVVMAMDLCFNKDQADGEIVKAEVKATLQMFEGSRNACPLLARFLNSLNDVLLKHKVQLNDPLGSLSTNTASGGEGAPTEVFDSPNTLNESANRSQDPILSPESSFDEFWQTAMESDMSYDSTAWDSMFSALDANPLWEPTL